ncbi:hypothetical protein SAMN05421503_1501 [Terribacillus aidingensis]|uniref:Uncharacterized protein n=1 Tax=Terribacillus aidingensis TaxID=586416 RepID=A0A285NQB4_9BACI|nr:hypothetical protein [Terribacillus aidingensis]SNZ10046.1 hypothetical protein SAMN05421503_1501 [Terribacillus aidingensis]
MIPISVMPPKEKVSAWVQRLHTFGPRYTGSAAHKASIQFFADEFAKLGDKQHFTKWEAED